MQDPGGLRVTRYTEGCFQRAAWASFSMALMLR